MNGHDVAPLHDCGEALERLLPPIEEFDLLLSDTRMPIMDAVALALQMARDLPDVPILLMTGYAEHRDRAYGLEALIKGIVQKPFTLAQIRGHVEAALGHWGLPPPEIVAMRALCRGGAPVNSARSVNTMPAGVAAQEQERHGRGGQSHIARVTGISRPDGPQRNIRHL